MATTAPMRAKAKVITAISARSRRPTRVETLMLSSSSRACSPVSTVVLAGLDGVFRPAHRMGGIDGENLADDEIVEQHADRGEMLLDGRYFALVSYSLDLGSIT